MSEIQNSFWAYFFQQSSEAIGPTMNGKSWHMVHHHYTGNFDNYPGSGTGHDSGPPVTGHKVCTYLGGNNFDFGFRRPGSTQIFVLSSEGGTPRQLSELNKNIRSIEWMSNDKVLFSSNSIEYSSFFETTYPVKK